VEQATPTGLVVDELWRYPVKSMGGERLAEVAVDALGMEGDRRWGIVDAQTGRVLTARRAPALLMARARHLGPGEVAITLPDGTTPSSDDDLSDWLGRRVALVSSSAEPSSASPEFEVPNPDEEDWQSFGAAEGAWHDSARARLSLVSRATVGEWDPRRFRSNVLLRGGGEDELVGATVGLGTATLEISKAISRCVMVTRPQPGLDADRSVLTTILRKRAGALAIGALVTNPGTLTEGSPLQRGGGRVRR
jgi:uncharacterized protein YcbX